MSRNSFSSIKGVVEVILLSPDHAAALYNLGWLDQIEGRFDSAREHYLAAIRADAQLWQAHQNLANLDVLRGKLRRPQRPHGNQHYPSSLIDAVLTQE